MIICLTGLIGAGKTTYAINNMQDDDEIIDWDEIKEDFDIKDNKIAKQIILDLLADAVKNTEVRTWFSCVFPSKEEQKLLDKANVKYIWVHCGLERSIHNLRKRNRNNEVDQLDLFFRKNVEILERSTAFISKYKVKIVAPYAVEERW